MLDGTEKFKTKGYLVTTDIKKAFHSLDHSLLLTTLEKFGFGTNFINWIKIFLNEEESCVTNRGVTTQYFKLGEGPRQGDPVSSYLFVLCLEILFTIVKNNKDIKSLRIIGKIFLYTAYADDTTFFLKDLGSIKELLNTISLFSSFSGLKPNLSKCKVAGIGLFKGEKVAVCGIKCIDLTKDVIKTCFLKKKNIELQSWPKYLAQSKEIQYNWTTLQ